MTAASISKWMGIVMTITAASLLAQGQQESEKLIPAFYRLPPGFISMPDRTNPYGNFQPLPGIKPLLQDGEYQGAYDARAFFKDQGITFPEDSEAVYFPKDSVLLVKNTRKNIDLIDTLCGGGGLGIPQILRTEITLVTFDPPDGLLDKASLSYDELKKAAGDSWKELASIEAVSKSGRTVVTSNVFGKALVEEKSDGEEPSKAPDLPPDASGSICLFEIVLGPDGQTMDAQVSFRHRSSPANDHPPLDVRFDGCTTLWDGYPQVLQLVKATNTFPAYALILRGTVALPSSWPIRIQSPNKTVN